MNTPIALSYIFDAVKIVNSVKAGQMKLSSAELALMQKLFDEVLFDIMGLKDEGASDDKSASVIEGLMGMVLEARAEAKAAKDWPKSDKIRNTLTELGITVKDTKDGVEWHL